MGIVNTIGGAHGAPPVVATNRVLLLFVLRVSIQISRFDIFQMIAPQADAGAGVPWFVVVT